MRQAASRRSRCARACRSRRERRSSPSTAELQKADLAVAEASVTNARLAFERAQTLLKTSAGTQKNYEDAQMALRSAEARLASSRTRLERRRVSSPVSGPVQQIYFRPGRSGAGRAARGFAAAAGQHQGALLRAGSDASEIALGGAVTIRCGGCADNIPARISFISRTSEFTPPVIYSQEERSKLVFLVEARPSAREACASASRSASRLQVRTPGNERRT